MLLVKVSMFGAIFDECTGCHLQALPT